jgi:hypothetical protein
MNDMGRNAKMRLDYFPMDIDIFADIKIRKLIKYQGGKAVAVYACLLCCIYKNGYYMLWDNELPFIVSEQTGFEEAYISEVIKNCVMLGLFNKELFENKQVLTSRGIQERYVKICRSAKRVGCIGEYNLLSPVADGDPIDVAAAKAAAAKVEETPPPPSENAAATPDYYSEMKSDRTWGEAVCVQFSIPSVGELDKEIDAFALHCRCEEKRHSNLNDAKRHFNSWLRYYKKDNRTNTKDNVTTDGKSGRRANRLGADAEAKDYSSGF